MPRKYFRKYLPTHEVVMRNRHFARFGALLRHPNLWHLNRRSVAGGVSVGLFAGLVPGPFQMIAAAIIAIPLRVNLPVALVMTLYTNPFTIGPLYLVAYQIGRLVVGNHATLTQAPEFDWSDFGGWLQAFMQWTLSLGKPLAIGLVALALILAAAGYVVVQLAWRIQVTLAWRRRSAQRQAHP